MDEDQSARRNAQKYLKIVDPDYYEFESHILIDDAFDVDGKKILFVFLKSFYLDYGQAKINKFVKQFIEKVDDAARYFSFFKIN